MEQLEMEARFQVDNEKRKMEKKFEQKSLLERQMMDQNKRKEEENTVRKEFARTNFGPEESVES
jgi:hypothetical protein